MTEIRKSTVAPVPPPVDPARSYDEAQLATVRRICNGCQKVFDVPHRLRAYPYVCARCADGK